MFLLQPKKSKQSKKADKVEKSENANLVLGAEDYHVASSDQHAVVETKQ